MIIYISGKMTGVENFNRDKFNSMADKLKELGHIPLNPAVLPDGLDYNEYIRIDLCILRAADAILMLDDWEDSKGAIMEKKYAEFLNLKVFYNLNELSKYTANPKI
jgi:hypothetical protein